MVITPLPATPPPALSGADGESICTPHSVPSIWGVTCAHHLREGRAATFHFLPFATAALAACNSARIAERVAGQRSRLPESPSAPRPPASLVNPPRVTPQLFDSSKFWVKWDLLLLLQKRPEPEQKDPD